MPTNKIALRSVEEFMADYVPTYRPIYPLFLNAKAQQYATEVGENTFKRITTIGDIRGKHILPKDTEIQQIAVTEGSKTFKKYFLGKQYVQSQLQDRKGIEDVVSQVLDEHQKQMDEIFLLGEGTSSANVLNNGLYFSADANYELEASVAVSSTDTLVDFHNKVMTTAQDANQLSGRKVIIFYGSTLMGKFNSLYSGAARAWKAVISEALGSDYSVITLPSAVTPASSDGWIIANLDQVKLHHTALPALEDQGLNAEKKYYWHNFLMGSMMLEVLADEAVIRQPCTFA